MADLLFNPGTPQDQILQGVGWNWFDHLGSGGRYATSEKYPLDAECHPDPGTPAWSSLLDHLDEARPGIIRFGLPPDRVCNEYGGFVPDKRSWPRLKALDQWARQHNCTIILDPFFGTTLS